VCVRSSCDGTRGREPRGRTFRLGGLRLEFVELHEQQPSLQAGLRIPALPDHAVELLDDRLRDFPERVGGIEAFDGVDLSAELGASEAVQEAVGNGLLNALIASCHPVLGVERGAGLLALVVGAEHEAGDDHDEGEQNELALSGPEHDFLLGHSQR
jgi:hypothetical protein